VGRVFAFALTAALNPTLLAAVTVMLTLQRPKRLLLGNLLGAILTSFTCGLLLVFTLPGSRTSDTAKHTVNPVIEITVGAIILLTVFAVAAGRDRRRRAWSERKRQRSRDKPPPRWKRTLSKLRTGHVRRRGTAELSRRVLHRGDNSTQQAARLDSRNRDRGARVQRDHARPARAPVARLRDKTARDRGGSGTIQQLAEPLRWPGCADRAAVIGVILIGRGVITA
jgi:hypothetical protein